MLPFVGRDDFCDFLGRWVRNEEIVDIVVIDDVGNLLRLLDLRCNERNLSGLNLIIVLKDFVIIKSLAHHFSTRYGFLCLRKRSIDK